MSTNNSSQVLSEQYILQLFNLEADQIQSMSITHKAEAVEVDIKLNVSEQTCPVCEFKSKKIKDYQNKKILHSVLTHHICRINYKARRYVCTACGKTFYEENPFAYKNMKISLLTVYNVLQDLKNLNETFSSVAKRYHLSPSTVIALFDAHVNISRRQLGKYINIDEVYAFKGDRSNYACVLLDYVTQQVIDILPTRKKLDLLSYFRQIPLEERKRVKIVAIDMWDTYRIVTKDVFPNAVNALDSFHLIQEFNRKLDTIRIKTQNTIRPSEKLKRSNTPEDKAEYFTRDNQYYVLKKFHWILLKNKDAKIDVDGKKYFLLDPNVPKKYNHKLKKYCNYYDFKDIMINIEPTLQTSCNFKFLLEKFYEDSDYTTAKDKLTELILQLSHSGIAELIDFSKTLIRWKSEIANSFIEIDDESKASINSKSKGLTRRFKLSNGIIENRNRAIKLIKNNSNGYHNWDRFRNRILYVLNDDATYRIYPIDDRSITKKEKI